MRDGLLVLTALSALIDWIAVARDRRMIEYFAKPATLVLLIAWYATSIKAPWEPLAIYVLVGLFFSLAGDIFLMFSSRWFIAGLIAFLIGHLAYIPGFLSLGHIWSSSVVLLAVGIGVIAFIILRPMAMALSQAGNKLLSVAIPLYGLILGLMFWAAASRLFTPAWPSPANWLAAVGGLLFFISDSILGWNRFVAPIPGGRLVEMICYHVAQFAIASSVLSILAS